MDSEKTNPRKAGKQMGNSPRQEVIQTLAREISAGMLPVGQRLPTEQQLLRRFRVSRGTVRSALRELAESGVVEHRPGIGCFVGNVSVSKFSGRTVMFLQHAEAALFGTQIAVGIETKAVEYGCSLSCHWLRDLPTTEQLSSLLKTERPLGVIYAPQSRPIEDYYRNGNQLLDFLEACNVPYVVVDSPIVCNGIIRGNFVGSDGYSATRQIAARLFELGHRRIGSIRTFPGVYSADHRFRGVIDQLTADRQVVRPEWHRAIDDVPLAEQGRRQIREMMALPEPPGAVICCHDEIALNVIDELGKLGRRVPEDVSISGFDDNYFSTPLGISTVRQPFSNVGSRAVEILVELNRSGSRTKRQEFIPCEVIFRKSVASPRLEQEV